MKDSGNVPRVNGAFPGTTSRADASPGDKTGTPLHKTLVDQQIAIPEAALLGANMVPNGVQEAVGVAQGDIESCQFLQAVQAMFQPPGTIVAWPHDDIPDGARYLPCEGQVILRATYPRLITNMERAYGAGIPAFYRCSALKAPDVSGDYMLLPNYSGLALRGRDTGATRDPGGASREFGDTQLDALQRHNHVSEIAGTPSPVYMTTSSVASGTGQDVLIPSPNKIAAELSASAVNIGDDISGFDTLGTAGVGRVDSETRMANSVIQFCIVY